MVLKGFTHARLACGCGVTFSAGVEGSPVTVVLETKCPSCIIPWHVGHLPLFDYREAMRPPTRVLLSREEEFEEEG